MKIRSTLHINGTARALGLFTTLEETEDHLALKLAASLFFFDAEPTIETGATHVALSGQEYWPDVMAADLSGGVTLWIECGKTTIHKLEKVSRRFRQARAIVLTEAPHQARQQAGEVERAGLKNVSVWSFAEGEFPRWRELVSEQNDIIGEATETSLNLVINGNVYMTDLVRLRG